MVELIQLVLQKSQFAIETKRDNVYGMPLLIQILFVHKFMLFVILVEAVWPLTK
jgi:hypothetical protein